MLKEFEKLLFLTLTFWGLNIFANPPVLLNDGFDCKKPNLAQLLLMDKTALDFCKEKSIENKIICTSKIVTNTGNGGGSTTNLFSQEFVNTYLNKAEQKYRQNLANKYPKTNLPTHNFCSVLVDHDYDASSSNSNTDTCTFLKGKTDAFNDFLAQKNNGSSLKTLFEINPSYFTMSSHSYGKETTIMEIAPTNSILQIAREALKEMKNLKDNATKTKTSDFKKLLNDSHPTLIDFALAIDHFKNYNQYTKSISSAFSFDNRDYADTIKAKVYTEAVIQALYTISNASTQSKCTSKIDKSKWPPQYLKNKDQDTVREKIANLIRTKDLGVKTGLPSLKYNFAVYRREDGNSWKLIKTDHTEEITIDETIRNGFEISRIANEFWQIYHHSEKMDSNSIINEGYSKIENRYHDIITCAMGGSCHNVLLAEQIKQQIEKEKTYKACYQKYNENNDADLDEDCSKL